MHAEYVSSDNTGSCTLHESRRTFVMSLHTVGVLADGHLTPLLASARRAFVRSRVRNPRRGQWCACIGDVRAREEGVLRQHERRGRRGSEPSLQSGRVRLLRSHSSRRCRRAPAVDDFRARNGAREHHIRCAIPQRQGLGCPRCFGVGRHAWL